MNVKLPIRLRSRKGNPIYMRPLMAARRRGLDRRLAGLDKQIGDPPFQGWIRTLREALGMSTFDFASRLGVTARRVLQLEQAETNGSNPALHGRACCRGAELPSLLCARSAAAAQRHGATTGARDGGSRIRLRDLHILP